MKKRLIVFLMIVVLTAVGLIPAVLAEDDTVPDSAGYYYVYTENGKGLNVRSTPGGEIVGSLKYGTRVYCYYRDGGNGWALIDYAYNQPGYGYGTYAAFISSRYLRRNKPAPYSPSGTPAPASSAFADATAEINAEFRSARRVVPFTVTVRPSRAGGWVNLRWAPSKSTEIMATYKQNDKLQVIRETNNWYQVEDQDTGDVGFISKQFVAQ